MENVKSYPNGPNVLQYLQIILKLVPIAYASYSIFLKVFGFLKNKNFVDWLSNTSNIYDHF